MSDKIMPHQNKLRTRNALAEARAAGIIPAERYWIYILPLCGECQDYYGVRWAYVGMTKHEPEKRILEHRREDPELWHHWRYLCETSPQLIYVGADRGNTISAEYQMQYVGHPLYDRSFGEIGRTLSPNRGKQLEIDDRC